MIDGVANVVLNYAKIIQRDFGNAIVVTPRYPGEQDDYPFPVIRYPSVKTPRTAGYRMGLPFPGIVREITHVDHRTGETDHRTGGTEHRTSGTDHRAGGTEHRTSETEHRTSETEHRAAGAEHNTSGKDHRTGGLERSQIDLIHCHCPFVSSVIARSLRQATGAPIIMTYHTKYDIDIANTFDIELLRTAAKRVIVGNIEACDEVWAVSNGSGQNLMSLGYKGGYSVMDNGVDFPKGPAPDPLIKQVAHDLGLLEEPSDVPVFLYVGRMQWYKNIRLILDGLCKAKAAGARFRMVFVGVGEDFNEIVFLANSLRLNNECIFAGIIRDRERLRAVYSLADMLLFPSTFDSAPLAVREAAACGTPGVLVRGSSAAEPVTDGRNAVLIDENADSLAWAVIELSRNMERIKKMGDCALEELYLPWDAAVSRAYEKYLEVLERHRPAR